MKTKIIEIRDSATFIPVMATLMESENEVESWYLRKTGYGKDSGLVMITPLSGGKAEYSPYDWDTMARTYPVAHKYIQEHWNELESGDVVCVETILGERETPKVSERREAYI